MNSAWDGFMKPDFTGYHHYGVWGNAYNIDALHTSCQMAMLLKDTPYALSESAVDNLANSLLAFRSIAVSTTFLADCAGDSRIVEHIAWQYACFCLLV